MNNLINVPNEEFLELTCVKDSVTGKGLNDKLTMKNNGDGTFNIRSGRVGIKLGPNKERVVTMPMEEWQSFFTWKTKAGYLVTKTHEMESVTARKSAEYDLSLINSPKVRELIEKLLYFANKTISESYSVTVENISDEMIALGKEVIGKIEKGIKEGTSVSNFNSLLMTLYAAIPRRMTKVGDHLAKSKEDFVHIYEEESELFNVMVSQVRNQTFETKGRSLLDVFGLEIREATADEYASIQKRLDGQLKLVNAYKIVNKKTEKVFNEFVDAEKCAVKQLFHGSKHQNWWSILYNGLWCEPEKHPEFTGSITGKAGGLGAYFAPNAIKSMGYTSFMGSKWANGNESTGFMALFKVATGKEYYGQNGFGCNFTYNLLQKTAPGSHCLWLKTQYSGFMMDEVIVYRESQFTIDFLLEVKR